MNKIKILNWNANGLNIRKMNELKHFVKQNNCDIIIITESHLLNDRKPLRIKGYNQTNLNRRGINGQSTKGGIIIYYKNELGAQNIGQARGQTENIGIQLPNKLKIYGVYIKSTELNKQDIEEILREEKTMAIGDFNARHPDWNNPTTNTNGRRLKELLEETPYMLYYPEEYTRYSDNGQTNSTIDLVITNNVNIQTIEIHQDLDSDHRPIIIEIKAKNTEEQQYRTIKDFDKAKWKEYKEYLNKNWTMKRNFINDHDIEQTAENLTKLIQEASDKYIPNKTKNQTTNPEITEAIKRRNNLRRRCQRNHSEILKRRIKEENELIQALLINQTTTYWDKKVKKAKETRQNMWQELRNIRRGDAMTVPILTEDGKIYYTGEEKANVIAKKIKNTPQNGINDMTTQEIEEENNRKFNEHEEQPNNNNLKTSPNQIKRIIKQIRPYKAPGYDGIQPKHLKKLTQKILAQLYYLYKECIDKNYFPKIWKKAIIIPIRKPGKEARDPLSYRPISLLPVMGKVLEKIINEELKDVIENKIIEEQFGFRRNHTCEMQLARIVNQIKINYNLKQTTTMLALDLKKAFDTVWHQGLINKMFKEEIPTNLIKLIKNYLEDRKSEVIVNMKKSQPFEVKTGIPQGGSLSSTLFLIYINDIPRNPKTKLALFADDTAIIATGKNEQRTNTRIQNHLQEIQEYFKKWKIEINPGKTQLINFNQKIRPINQEIVKINNIPIDTTNEITYLGMKLDRKLTFKNHIEKVRNSAQLATKTIYPFINKNCKLPSKMKIQLYNTYVRPILTHNAPIWSSAADTYMKRIQTIENKAMRIILNKKAIDIKNKELIRQTQITPVLHRIKKQWEKFFTTTIHKNPLTTNIADITPNTAPYRIKHKLINYRMYENED